MRAVRSTQLGLVAATLFVGVCTAAWSMGEDGNGRRILWVNAGNGQTDCTYDPGRGTGSIRNHGKSGLSQWAEALSELGFVHEELLENEIELTCELLAPFDYAVFSFNIRPYSADEAAALAEWVGEGGRALFIAGYALGNGDTNADNGLLAPFHIAYRELVPVRATELAEFEPHAITEGVSLVKSDVPSALDAPAGAQVLARYAGLPALVLLQFGRGAVVAFWDSNCFFNGVYDAHDLPSIHDADNRRFAVNLFRYPLSSEEPPAVPEDATAYPAAQADPSGNQQVDYRDLLRLAAVWQRTRVTTSPAGAAVDGFPDGTAEARDLLGLIGRWHAPK